MKYKVSINGTTEFTVNRDEPGQGKRVIRELLAEGTYLELPGGRTLRVPWECVVVSVTEIPDAERAETEAA